VTDRDSAAEAALDAELRREGERLRAARAGCPPPDLLLARRSEALDDDVHARLDTHVAECAACRRMAADLDQVDVGAADAEAEGRLAARVLDTSGRGRGGVLSIAAALLLASGLAVSWGYLRPRPEPPETAVQTTPPSPPAETPAIVALWTITAPAVRLPLSSLGATRSAEAPLAAPDLVDALVPYRSGDYAGAVERLGRVVEAQPESGEALFYLGVSQLMTGKAQPAVSSLERAARLLPADRRAEAEWYLATAEQRNGATDAARTRLQTLCSAAGRYQSNACAAVTALK
jgi:tetratricopeptide (TPR) repeat protein